MIGRILDMYILGQTSLKMNVSLSNVYCFYTCPAMSMRNHFHESALEESIQVFEIVELKNNLRELNYIPCSICHINIRIVWKLRCPLLCTCKSHCKSYICK